MVTLPGHTVTSPAAVYHWPEHDDLTAECHGTGGFTIALGLLPHANEPLGYAIRPQLTHYTSASTRLALIGPIDPPPRNRRFPLPCDLVTFLAEGHLQPLSDQAEFAHCLVPHSPAQHRAAALRDLVGDIGTDVLVLVHNDPFARVPYLYVNEAWPEVERHLRDDLADVFPASSDIEDADWTRKVGGRSYAFFPCAEIGVDDGQSAGLFLAEHLGLSVLTVELPMFAWGAAEDARQAMWTAMGEWIQDGAGDTAPLAAEAARMLGGHAVPMIPAAVSARVLWSVAAGIQDRHGISDPHGTRNRHGREA